MGGEQSRPATSQTPSGGGKSGRRQRHDSEDEDEVSQYLNATERDNLKRFYAQLVPAKDGVCVDVPSVIKIFTQSLHNSARPKKLSVPPPTSPSAEPPTDSNRLKTRSKTSTSDDKKNAPVRRVSASPTSPEVDSDGMTPAERSHHNHLLFLRMRQFSYPSMHRFIEIMIEFMCGTGKLSSADAFASFVVQAARAPSQKALQLLWEISAYAPHLTALEAPDQLLTVTGVATFTPSNSIGGSYGSSVSTPVGYRAGHKPPLPDLSCGIPVEERVVQFCYVLLLLTVCCNDENSLQYEAWHLAEFYSSIARRHSPSQSLVSTPTTLFGVVNEWSPFAAKALQGFMSAHLLNSLRSPSFKPFRSITLLSPSEVFATHKIMDVKLPNFEEFSSEDCHYVPVELAGLSLFTDACQGSWTRLYCSSTDGMSFSRIVHSALGYDGPTVLLIRCDNEEGTVIGALCGERWIELNKFYGSSRNLLFTVSPRLRVYRTKPANNGAFQWTNQSSFGLPHGLGFGGTVDGFRLFLPDSLEECTARTDCPTYEGGRLVPGDFFNVHTIEVWGAGGDNKVVEALAAQVGARKLASVAMDKARKVDKGAFFGNEFDREMFLSKTTGHNKHGDQQQC